jgi:F-type H+-transporting ATPase subunit delta
VADNNTIARPYAEAAFEIANDNGELGAWSAALEMAGAMLADGQVATFLANPSLSADQRLEFLRDLFKAAGKDGALFAGKDDKGSNFLKLLLEYGRVNVLPEISGHFEALKADVENTVDVIITSAAPMSEAQENLIAKALKKRLGRDVRIETKIDESLIGGAVIRAGDVVIDGSLRARLSSLSNALIA